MLGYLGFLSCAFTCPAGHSWQMPPAPYALVPHAAASTHIAPTLALPWGFFTKPSKHKAHLPNAAICERASSKAKHRMQELCAQQELC